MRFLHNIYIYWVPVHTALKKGFCVFRIPIMRFSHTNYAFFAYSMWFSHNCVFRIKGLSILFSDMCLLHTVCVFSIGRYVFFACEYNPFSSQICIYCIQYAFSAYVNMRFSHTIPSVIMGFYAFFAYRMRFLHRAVCVFRIWVYSFQFTDMRLLHTRSYCSK